MGPPLYIDCYAREAEAPISPFITRQSIYYVDVALETTQGPISWRGGGRDSADGLLSIRLPLYLYGNPFLDYCKGKG